MVINPINRGLIPFSLNNKIMLIYFVLRQLLLLNYLLLTIFNNEGPAEY